MTVRRSVAMVTLGCARNEVDSEEIAGRLADAGWDLVPHAADADVAVVNTCGFIEAAKKDSIDVLLEAAQLRDASQTRTAAVVAVGCLAERYGNELATSLPEADAVLGFDSYADLASHLDSVLAGHRPVAHQPRDRRTLLPLAPADRPPAANRVAIPGHGVAPEMNPLGQNTDGSASQKPSVSGPDLPPGLAPASGPRVLRRRLDGRPWAPLKIASGCDRRCSFCAIPAFRGALTSRRVPDVLAEAEWLAAQGVREVLLVSENSSSYGKDLGEPRALEGLLPQLAAVPGLAWVRVSYLQPAEVRPGLVDVMTSTPGVLPYFDVPFQHASGSVLRRMRRFGDGTSFLALIDRIRQGNPMAGIRANVIVGFPGETEDDVAELTQFLEQAQLDAVGVFGYSDEEGTEAATLPDQVDAEEIADRVRSVTDLAEQLLAERAEQRIGHDVEVLIEEVADDGVRGRAAHQGPDVDGCTDLISSADLRVGDVVVARVIQSGGVDLVAEPVRREAR
ncbi:MAG: 30S ribosomal protein S12 methylthiotransferase RimO [Actinomycetota bacterium]